MLMWISMNRSKWGRWRRIRLHKNISFKVASISCIYTPKKYVFCNKSEQRSNKSRMDQLCTTKNSKIYGLQNCSTHWLSEMKEIRLRINPLQRPNIEVIFKPNGRWSTRPFVLDWVQRKSEISYLHFIGGLYNREDSHSGRWWWTYRNYGMSLLSYIQNKANRILRIFINGWKIPYSTSQKYLMIIFLHLFQSWTWFTFIKTAAKNRKGHRNDQVYTKFLWCSRHGHFFKTFHIIFFGFRGTNI